ncbi:hypothetical protein B0H14DRAFT_2605227 [Mycena olivaceomarginata]|nr:hypothetical protein B0H14DRAFT_2605227 [Mycena olivaceomarginata]
MVPSVQICPKEKRLIEKEEEQDKLETSIKSSTHGGSTWWMAPDLLLLNVFSPDLSFCSTIESDVWAFTCLLRENGDEQIVARMNNTHTIEISMNNIDCVEVGNTHYDVVDLPRVQANQFRHRVQTKNRRTNGSRGRNVKSCLSYTTRYFPEPSTVIPLPWSDPEMLRLVNTKERSTPIAPRQRFLCKYLVENPPVRVGLVVKYLQSFQGDLYLLPMVVGILSAVDVSKATVISRTVFQQEYIMNLKFLRENLQQVRQKTQQPVWKGWLTSTRVQFITVVGLVPRVPANGFDLSSPERRQWAIKPPEPPTRIQITDPVPRTPLGSTSTSTPARIQNLRTVQNCKGLVLRDTLNISLVRVDLEQRFEYFANVDVVLLQPPLEVGVRYEPEA